MAAKRYLVSGGTDDEGYPLLSFVVEVDGEELDVGLRERAQQMFKDGETPEAVAEYMGGTVAKE